jgi:putative DNA primase/helicase
VGLSFNTWAKGENSKEPLIGKRVGVFADVRFKAGRAFGRVAFDAGGITPSAELLLNITGEDTITIGRKYKGAWHGQLGMKVMVISNEVPNLNDSQGVLPSRFIKLAFTRSFFGHEDAYLRAKLEAELPGIAGRCVGAYGRLVREQRMFVQPQSGRALEQELIEASDPLQAMLAACFVVDAGATCVKAMAHYRFEEWCEQNGRWDLKVANRPQQFSKTLAELVPGLADAPRPHGAQRSYLGIRLRKQGEL